MTVKQQWLVVVGIIALLGGGAFTASHFLKDELTSVTVGSDAPGFIAQTLDTPAQTKSLTNYRGDVVVLNIWATWCIPCRKEMPSMEALYKELGPKGLKIVAVSVDDAGAGRRSASLSRNTGSPSRSCTMAQARSRASTGRLASRRRWSSIGTA